MTQARGKAAILAIAGPCCGVLEQNERARRFHDSDGWQADGAMQEDDYGGRKLMALRYALSL